MIRAKPGDYLINLAILRSSQVTALHEMLDIKKMQFPIDVILVCIRFLPLLEKIFCKHKRPVDGSWRMDETNIKVKGIWKYLYRAVDKE